jgi:hypothetical protein
VLLVLPGLHDRVLGDGERLVVLAGAAERLGEGALVRGHPEAGQHRLELLQRRSEIHDRGREVAVFVTLPPGMPPV